MTQREERSGQTNDAAGEKKSEDRVQGVRNVSINEIIPEGVERWVGTS